MGIIINKMSNPNKCEQVSRILKVHHVQATCCHAVQMLRV